MGHIKNAKTLEEAQSIFTEEEQSKYNIQKVYDAFKRALAKKKKKKERKF